MNGKSFQAKIGRIFGKSLVRNTLWLLFSKLFTVVMQAGYFIIVARVLGSENYGAFVGITSLASIVYPFSALGNDHILIQSVSRKKSQFNIYWGNALFVIILASLALTVVILFISPLIFPESISILEIFLILLADLTSLAFIDLTGKAFLAVDLVKKLGQFQIFYISIKFIAALIFALCFPSSNSLIWAAIYLISSMLVAVVGVLYVNRFIGAPQPVLSKIPAEISQGIFFSISASATNINASVDRTMLASMSTLQATGIYGAAYRFIDVGYVPLLAILSATYAKFFEQGAAGIGGTLKLAKRILPVSSAYGIVSLIGYLVFSPFLPIILGEEYRGAIDALRWLAPIPCIAVFQFIAADTLTGAGYQKTRSIIQVSSALLNIGLNFWLIPQYSWKGAAWATLISDVLKTICLWVLVFFLYKKTSKKI